MIPATSIPNLADVPIALQNNCEPTPPKSLLPKHAEFSAAYVPDERAVLEAYQAAFDKWETRRSALSAQIAAAVEAANQVFATCEDGGALDLLAALPRAELGVLLLQLSAIRAQIAVYPVLRAASPRVAESLRKEAAAAERTMTQRLTEAGIPGDSIRAAVDRDPQRNGLRHEANAIVLESQHRGDGEKEAGAALHRLEFTVRQAIGRAIVHVAGE